MPTLDLPALASVPDGDVVDCLRGEGPGWQVFIHTEPRARSRAAAAAAASIPAWREWRSPATVARLISTRWVAARNSRLCQDRGCYCVGPEVRRPSEEGERGEFRDVGSGFGYLERHLRAAFTSAVPSA